MSNTFSDTLRDVTLRIEVGSAVTSDLAVENLDLSTIELSQAVRRSVIARRAGGPRRSPNFLSMTEVRFPPAVVSMPASRAA
jgi:hypothetical protein